jgi:hypothetical protein
MADIRAMAGKVSYKIVGPYSYSRIESALALVFNVPSERLKHLRGRIKHTMRIAAPTTGPGKGARVLYGADVILRWLMALLLQDIGVPPAVAVRAIREEEWKRLRFDRSIKQALDRESLGDPEKGVPANPVYMTLRPMLVPSSWDEKNPPLWIGFRRRYDFERAKRLKTDPYNLKPFVEGAARDGTWACARNFTLDLKRLTGRLESDVYDFNKSIENEP